MHSTSPQPVQQSPRAHSPAPQAIPAEPVQDVGASIVMKSDEEDSTIQTRVKQLHAERDAWDGTEGVRVDAPSREDVQFLIDLAAKESTSTFERRTLVRIARQLAHGVDLPDGDPQ